ncbi:CO dehydrogenase/CO-methylating acetyl-CoA synthase complex subunit beta [Methermicoccus shengliensis]|uniref:Acetyl-CoA decarbonylase/synthase complex subunit beta n=1 Tax=Methermicoccus shengliensis TaxID=660064 RepID=A0A832RX94_9EURY|nr:CO dehydrogenase/CO-methylating acetyl-CoA synthase complex subunit beta [Methermicoccus shengliensis]KUK04002.1 MAG: Acetyl-CoA decarbonylase/synthase complex subunit beta [Euryarchaeota archaeon 55_53]KUK29676.1 MAG: Acetyl-CoA decarbonylase/synthase complex subunit beta [Methanosarcinales archeaon 56_1174]MDI3487770.1 acetyl-CoA decarbonylase/synthase, complex subunit beta [Methanosarcinales archaeon]MDN5294874.1 acetyl-CoA decarbonylase/synthase, complex subunit beta [Methanosarcinales a
MSDEFPFEISPMFEGERVRKDDMFVELAGPKSIGFELVRVAQMDEIEDGKFTLVGPDIKDMEEGGRYPYAMIYRIAGEQVETDLEAIVERRNHDFQNYIQGYMHLNQRYDIWVRIHKDMIKRGLSSLEQIAKATMMLFKSELPFIEKIEAIYITDEEKVREELDRAMEVYQARDERTRNLHDEDVDVFYGCTLCQSFAPTNVCVITPDRISLCGAINWFDGRAAAKVDPEGPQFPIPKGECIDEVGGEYTGVNEKAVELSGGEYSRIKLHSFFEYPHTSCGCFEVVGFYMPEVDGIGWVDRDFDGIAPNGLPFSTMAGQTGGGKQVVGFLGIGINYLRSPKFIQADGGWKRTVWLTKRLKDKVYDDIPEDIRDAIPTEEEVSDLESLKQYLMEHNHPVVERWEKPEEEVSEGPSEEAVQPAPQGGMQVSMTPMQLPSGFAPVVPQGSSGGRIKITFKNAVIKIGKVELKEEKKRD